jgi:predicted alpha/beta superfamily hydrolase
MFAKSGRGSKLVRCRVSNTRLTVRCEVGPGNRVFLRGQSPLSWDEGVEMSSGGPDLWQLDMSLERAVRVKLLVNDEQWSVGENYLVKPRRETTIFPNFVRTNGGWQQHREVFQFKGDPVRVWVYFPPSYDHNVSKSYPVLYCQDGQTLFDDVLTRETSEAGVELRMDEKLDDLILSGMMDEILVVGIEARNESKERHVDYTPFEDSRYHGGDAGDYLGFLLNQIKPSIDNAYRTIPEQNGVMGSSLGGLFAFYAARTFPQIFQRVLCMSSSFWWAHQDIIRQVEISDEHYPQKIYLDAGLAEADEREAAEDMLKLERALTKDGYRLGVDLLTRLYESGAHNQWSWRERIEIPLSYLYPWQDGVL